MASNSSDNRSGSPMQLGITGQFSPEDIQELLGVMGDGTDPHQHPERLQDEAQLGAVSQPAHTHGTMHVEGSATASATSSAVVNPNVAMVGAPVASTQAAPCTSQNLNQGVGVGEEAKAQARSERKRSREKQRRSDVNKQFSDLTHLLQRIDAEDVNADDLNNGATCNRVTFNPSNRVDLIARTIVLLERLHEANKRRKIEISSLQQQLDEAKKAGEDTAAKLKEAMLAPAGQPTNKPVMMMVPMMMSSDSSGAPVPVMNPFMQQQAAMQHQVGMQSFCPMPPQAINPAVAAAPHSGAAQAPLASTGAAPAAPFATPTMMAAPVAATHPQQPGQPAVPPTQAAAFQYMMPPIAGGAYMMPIPAASHHMSGQPIAMVQQHISTVGVQQRSSSDQQSGQQEQKESSPSLNGGSNLAHCA